MKKNSLLFVLVLILFVLVACKKETERIVCFDCKTPIVIYHFKSPTDSFSTEYALDYNVNPNQDQIDVDSSYTHRGYILTIDTLWTTLIAYNIGYSQSDYNQIIYPASPQYFNTYCVKQ